MFSVDQASGRSHFVMMAALFFLLSSIYLLTYKVGPLVNDELEMIDRVRSLVDFGDAKYDIALWYKWDRSGRTWQNNTGLYPLGQSNIEPVYMYMGVPLYALTKIIPGLGTVHVLWLSNSIISAAACVLMFHYARLLGYRDRVALTSALALGLCTILWPYTQAYLREPLALFLLLLAAYFFEKSRSGGWQYIPAGLLTFVVAFFCKEPILLAFPGLLLILLSGRIDWSNKRRVRLGLNAGLMVVLLIPLLLIYTDLVPTLLSQPVHLFAGYSLRSDFSQVALHSYLLSPGGSIWGTSPILLLALPGSWLLLRRQQSRYVWVMVLSVFGFAVGHALLAGPNWFGGSSWPPRFLIPAIPFLLIGALPAIEWIVNRPSHLVVNVLVGLLIIYSLWWQFSGVSLSWYTYGGALPPESHQFTSWSGGLNQARYFRPVVLTPVWLERPLAFTWAHTRVYGWPVVFGLFAVLWGAILWRGDRIVSKIRGAIIGMLAIVFIVTTLGLLTLFYRRDARFLGNRASLHAISAWLDAEEQPGDVLIVNDPIYEPFYLNYSGFNEVRVIVLPSPPGERGSFVQVPKVLLADVADVGELLQPSAPSLIDALAARRERLWVLMETGPFIPWSIRPLERFMAQRYYLIREVQTNPPDPTVRLLEYSTVHAPEATAAPDSGTDLVFGDLIHLTGFTLPAGTTYQPGDVLPVTLYWQAETAIERDYIVALFLANADNFPVAQGIDGAPQGGFAPTSSWSVGAPIQDNRALRLPEDLPSGQYRLWLRLYSWEGQTIEHLFANGTTIREATIGVLPITLTVE